MERTGGDRKLIWHHAFPCIGSYRFVNYARVVAEAEVQTRTGFRDLLAGWNLPPTATPGVARQPEVLPAGVAERLGSLAEVDQFANLQALHDQVRRDGGSPPRWLAMARGYATLGSLVEPLWNADHAILKARGLLYAHKAGVVVHDSPGSLREQAFGEAVAGMFASARSDLALADKADGGRGETVATASIRAYLTGDPVALGELAARSPADPLPLYFRAMVQARLSGLVGAANHICRNEIITAQDDLLAKVPDCYRTIDRPDFARSIAEQHLANNPPSPVDAANLAVACDKLGDTKARDEAIDRLVKEPEPTGPKTAQVLAILADWHRQPAKGPLDLARVDALLAEGLPERRPVTDTVVGLFLAMYGQPAEGLPYLKKGDVPANSFGYRLLARQALQARGEPVAEWLVTARPTSASKPTGTTNQ